MYLHLHTRTEVTLTTSVCALCYDRVHTFKSHADSADPVNLVSRSGFFGHGKKKNFFSLFLTV